MLHYKRTHALTTTERRAICSLLKSCCAGRCEIGSFSGVVFAKFRGTDTIAGAAGLVEIFPANSRTINIAQLGVLPMYRNVGIGSMILEFARQKVYPLHHHTLFLAREHPDTPLLYRFFLHRGFEVFPHANPRDLCLSRAPANLAFIDK